MAAGRVHRLIRLLTGRGDLGLYQRDFPDARSREGQSLGSFTHWFLNASIAGVFPVVAANSTAMPFFVFALMMLVQFVIVLTLFPETKGAPLEEIDRRLRA